MDTQETRAALDSRAPITIEDYDKYKNKAKCRNCNTTIESRHRHDFVSCQCGSIFVDGGNDYWRAGGSAENFERIFERLDGS